MTSPSEENVRRAEEAVKCVVGDLSVEQHFPALLKGFQDEIALALQEAEVRGAERVKSAIKPNKK